MNSRNHARLRNHQAARRRQAEYALIDEAENYDGYYDDDEWECTWCGGEGFDDDPNWDDWTDENGYAPCKACSGTGLRKHQTCF